MNSQHRPAAVGFHSGELAAQRQAGVQAEAARLARMVGPAELRGGTAAFLADARFAALTARDGAGRLWTSPLLAAPGFLQASGPNTLRIGTTLPAADPLHSLPVGQAAGLVVIDFTTRRRVRINGALTASDEAGMTLDVDQAYGNCPQYIHQRHITVGEKPPQQGLGEAEGGEGHFRGGQNNSFWPSRIHGDFPVESTPYGTMSQLTQARLGQPNSGEFSRDQAPGSKP